MANMTHWRLFLMRVECIKTPYGGAKEANILVSAERDEKPDLTEQKERNVVKMWDDVKDR